MPGRALMSVRSHLRRARLRLAVTRASAIALGGRTLSHRCTLSVTGCLALVIPLCVGARAVAQTSTWSVGSPTTTGQIRFETGFNPSLGLLKTVTASVELQAGTTSFSGDHTHFYGGSPPGSDTTSFASGNHTHPVTISSVGGPGVNVGSFVFNVDPAGSHVHTVLANGIVLSAGSHSHHYDSRTVSATITNLSTFLANSPVIITAPATVTTGNSGEHSHSMGGLPSLSTGGQHAHTITPVWQTTTNFIYFAPTSTVDSSLTMRDSGAVARVDLDGANEVVRTAGFDLVVNGPTILANSAALIVNGGSLSTPTVVRDSSSHLNWISGRIEITNQPVYIQPPTASGLEEFGDTLTIGTGKELALPNDALIVGQSGTGSLTVSGSGTLRSDVSRIGNFATGTVTLQDSGTWTTTEDLHVGPNGTGTLNILDDAHVISGSGNISALSSGGTGQVDIGAVSSDGGTWTVLNSLNVGSSAGTSSAALSLYNGGLVEVGDTLTIRRTGEVFLDNGKIIAETLVNDSGAVTPVSITSGISGTGAVEVDILTNHDVIAPTSPGDVLSLHATTLLDNSGGVLGAVDGATLRIEQSVVDNSSGFIGTSIGGIVELDQVHVSGGFLTAAIVPGIIRTTGVSTLTDVSFRPEPLSPAEVVFEIQAATTLAGTGIVDSATATGVSIVNSSTLNFDDYTLTNPNGIGVVTLTNDTSSTLSGNGSVALDVLNDGTVAPGNSAGVLAIDGDFAQSSTGLLVIEIGGTLPGAEFDVLEISGSATLAGIFEVSLIDGFIPAYGDVFEVLTFDSLIGTFDDFVGLDISSGKRLVPVFGPNSLSLMAVPEPSSWLLAAIGTLGVLAVRRRRRETRHPPASA